MHKVGRVLEVFSQGLTDQVHIRSLEGAVGNTVFIRPSWSYTYCESEPPAVFSRWLGLMTDGKYLTTLPAYPLASIGVPTLVLHGTSDKIIPFASAERTAAAISEAQLVTIDNGSHFASFLGHRELSGRVQEFLERATQDQSA